MRNIIVMITAFLAMMVSMTGIAAASPYDLSIWNAAGTAAEQSPIQLLPGGSVTLSLHTANTVNDLDTFAIAPATITPTGGGGGAGDITVTYTTGVLTPGGSDPYTQVGEVTISLAATAPVGATYNIAISATGSNPFDIGLASRGVSSIPEFPTIALPIAAVIGLVFFFQHRKRNDRN